MAKPVTTKMNKTFSRTVSQELIDKLKEEPLYLDHLLPDIQTGVVFPAFRNNRIDFYYQGSKLFSFDGNFYTHRKYASLINLKTNNSYITENDLKESVSIKAFTGKDVYPLIKNNAELYLGNESHIVSKIYHQSSFAALTNNNIVVLDIEISFDARDLQNEDGKKKRDRKQDRIGMVIFDCANHILYFVEAKHFKNGELWSIAGTTPDVINQLNRYNTQINKQESKIISSYNNYIKMANQLFDKQISDVVSISPKTTLLVFGFDQKQATKLKKLLVADGSLNEHSYRFIGKPGNAEGIIKNIKIGTPFQPAK